MTGRWAACRTHTLAALLFLATVSTAFAATHYVDVNSANATPPYTNWATAATNIQDAVDAALAGDEVVVTNGIYVTGGRNGNRVEVNKPLSVRSVNGPPFTVITGSGTNRCAYLATNASLSGFTLTGGAIGDLYYDYGGAGVYCESLTAVVSNCALGDNEVFNGYSDAYGGGAFGGTLNNCTLGLNAAVTFGGYGYGGGAAYCTLNNCALADNGHEHHGYGLYTEYGGGAYACTLNNCVLSGNYGVGAYFCVLANCTLTGNAAGASGCTLTNCIACFNSGANYDSSCALNYCCTTPPPTNGVGNISCAPLFVDTNGWANLRLQSDSPCINAGNNASAPAGPDLDGNPRIVGGTVDIGPYEYQSLFLLNFSVVSNQAGFNITGQSNQVVIVETSTDLLNWSPLATNTLSGHPFPFSDPTPPTQPQRFYRAQAQ